LLKASSLSLVIAFISAISESTEPPLCPPFWRKYSLYCLRGPSLSTSLKHRISSREHAAPAQCTIIAPLSLALAWYLPIIDCIQCTSVETST